jgi:hypothetical protein
VEQELRAIGVWSDEPTPLFLHEMVSFRKVPRDKGELTCDQELIGTVHGVISQRCPTATTRTLHDVHESKLRVAESLEAHFRCNLKGLNLITWFSCPYENEHCYLLYDSVICWRSGV